MIGANDRQQMFVEGNREEPRSEAWMGEYEVRIRKLGDGRAGSTRLISYGSEWLPFRFRSIDLRHDCLQ